jgi:hypothetical protein
MYKEDKICKNTLLKRLDNVETAVRYVFRKNRIKLNAFLSGLDHAREIIKNTISSGTLIEKIKEEEFL